MRAHLVIQEHTLGASRGIARMAVQRLPVRDEKVQRTLETFVTTYEAVRQACGHHDAALHVAAHEARRTCSRTENSASNRNHRTQATQSHESYPAAPAELLERIDYAPEALARHFSYLARASRERVRFASTPETITISDRQYILQEPIRRTTVLGLDKEQNALTKYARQLFLYDPIVGDNVDTGRFPKTILLTGPPGTGKSSLIGNVFASCRELQRLTGTPCTLETYDASNFSSYFGRSTKILKRTLMRVEKPSGIGVLAIEDADMVLQSRDDSTAYHGVLELQQYLMNRLSGITPYRGNTLTIFSTNRPDALDEALRSRIERVYHIDPFGRAETHAAYFAQALPHLSEHDIHALGSHSHSARLSGRDLASILTLARESATREPTDDELRNRASAQSEERYATVTRDAVAALIAARTMIQHN